MPVDLARLTQALADRYAVEREIGQGGMAIVYLARDLQHHRPVALKVLRPEIAASVGRDRFHQEIEIAAGLSHPHVLPVYDSGEADDFLYYVMPYVEGESLAQRLKRVGQLPLDDALGIAIEVADGLGYAHDHGVVHRDVKPDNILLSSGHAVISDFGIARAINLAGGERLTRTGMAVGSILYMSPEQAGADERVDGRSDIYALGCVLFEMLGGEPPFTGRTPQAIIARRLTDTPPSLCVLRDTVPPGVERVVGKALHKAPADRFGSAREFADALRDATPRSDTHEEPARGESDWSLNVTLIAYAITTVLVVGLSLTLAGRSNALLLSGIALAVSSLAVTAVTALVQGRPGSDGRGAPTSLDRFPRVARIRRGLHRHLTWRRSLGANLVVLGLWGLGTMAWKLTGTSATPTNDVAVGHAGFDPTHVAVLYFDDTSRDGELAYFARGLTETAIHELTQVDRLHVISTNGVSGLGNVSHDSVARALSVGTVIDGSVTKSGDRIRVSAQMIETDGMTQIASIQRESTPGGDWLAVVDSIVGDIAVGFRGQLGIEVRVRERAAGTSSEGAWRHVHQAEQLWEEAAPFMREGDVDGAKPILLRADSLLDVAAGLDPTWPEPVVVRGWVAADLADLLVPGVGYDPQWLDRGLELAEDALARAPASPQSLELRGFLRYQKWQATAGPSCDLVEAAEADLRRSVEIDDSRVRAWVTLADLLQYAKGSFASARNAAGAAYTRDAFLSDTHAILERLATLSADLEDASQALQWAEEGRHRFPEDVIFPALELHVLTHGGSPDVARGWGLVETTERLSSPRTRGIYRAIMEGKMAAVLARAGLDDSARAVLARARADAPPEALEFLPQEEAHAWLLMGDSDAALDALTSYLDTQPDERAYAARDPWWRPLHGDPRFEAIVERTSYACGES